MNKVHLYFKKLVCVIAQGFVWCGLAAVSSEELNAGSVCADGERIVIGTGKTMSTNVSETTVFDAAMLLSDRAVLEKTGSGKLTVSAGGLVRNQQATIRVREGAIAVSDSVQTLAEYPEPKEVMNKAAFWLEATTNLKLRENSETEIEEWRDVRETGDGSAENPFLYLRAVTNFQCSTVYPQKKQYREKNAVYFGGFGKGCWMNWVNQDGTQGKVSGVRNVFLVQGAANSWGHALGQRKGSSPYFQPGTSSVWNPHNSENRPMHASRTYLNGCEIDPFTTAYVNGNHYVVEVECLGDSQTAMCFFNDRDMQITWPDGTKHTNAEGKYLNPFFNSTAQNGGNDRVGGEYVYEMLLFSVQLTDEERMAVSDWLNQKWRGVLPPSTPPAVTVMTASNTVVDIDGQAFANCSYEGDAMIRKVGEDTARIRSRYEARGSSLTHLAVEEGTLDIGYALPFVCGAGDTVSSVLQYWGYEMIPPVAGLDKTKLVKTGNGPLLLDRIPDGVNRIEVTGGQLILADPESAAGKVDAPLVEQVATPASDSTFSFEEFDQQYGLEKRSINIDTSTGTYGWHAIVPPTDGYDSRAFVFSSRSGQDMGQSWDITISAADGYCSIATKNNASIWTEVEFPEDGYYTYSVWVAGRKGQIGIPMQLMLGKDKDHLEQFGTITRKDGACEFKPFHVRTPFLRAGTYQFWIKCPAYDTALGTIDTSHEWYNKDKCYQYDKMSFVKDATHVGRYVIPNGDFEIHEPITSFALSSANRVFGFSVKQADNFGTTTVADEISGNNALSTFSVDGTDNWAHFNLPWNREGSLTQFYMTGNGSQLSTTFTPEAGVWRLKADFCYWAVTYAGERGAYSAFASVKIGETVTELGEVKVSDHKLIARVWPKPFETDGVTPVTLTLTGNVSSGACGHGILDNLELTSALPSADLLLVGDFEDANCWKVASVPRPSTVGGSERSKYNSFLAQYFTADAFSGAYCFKLVNDETVYTSTSIELKEGELYRLAANMTTRCNPQGPINFGSGENPVAPFVALGSYTNWIGCTDTIKTTNFNEYAFQFRVPETGNYTIGFKGQSHWSGTGTPMVDRTALIDAVTVCKITTGGTIDLPENLDLDLAKGTQLRLDFDGTKKIDRLRINGRRYTGLVSLETHPELLPYLAGRGALEVRKYGLTLIVR